jgi:hypothetical protein
MLVPTVVSTYCPIGPPNSRALCKHHSDVDAIRRSQIRIPSTGISNRGQALLLLVGGSDSDLITVTLNGSDHCVQVPQLEKAKHRLSHTAVWLVKKDGVEGLSPNAITSPEDTRPTRLVVEKVLAYPGVGQVDARNHDPCVPACAREGAADQPFADLGNVYDI